MIKKIEHEKLLMQSFSELSVKILQLTKERGRITVSEIERLTNAARGTIKARLCELVHDNHLLMHKKWRSSYYTLS